MKSIAGYQITEHKGSGGEITGYSTFKKFDNGATDSFFVTNIPKGFRSLESATEYKIRNRKMTDIIEDHYKALIKYSREWEHTSAKKILESRKFFRTGNSKRAIYILSEVGQSRFPVSDRCLESLKMHLQSVDNKE